MKYRSRTEIVRQILDTARQDSNGITKTKIMYESYLSYAQLKDYLAMLTENDLIEHNPARNTYKTTYRGIQTLHVYDQMNGLMEKHIPK